MQKAIDEFDEGKTVSAEDFFEEMYPDMLESMTDEDERRYYELGHEFDKSVEDIIDRWRSKVLIICSRAIIILSTGLKQRRCSLSRCLKILEAGNVAPTAVNYQPQRIYVLQSEEALTKVKSLCPCTYGAPTVLLIAYDDNQDWKNEKTVLIMPLGYATDDAKPVEKWHFGYKKIEETVTVL